MSKALHSTGAVLVATLAGSLLAVALTKLPSAAQSIDGITAPGHARRLAEALPSARLAVVAGAGHWPQVERPAETLEQLAAFLSAP